MLTEATFNQTNFYFSFLWYKISSESPGKNVICGIYVDLKSKIVAISYIYKHI
jgi:hypothetical protein